MQINFHSRLWSYLPRVPIFLTYDCICDKDVCKFVVKLIYLVCFKLFK